MTPEEYQDQAEQTESTARAPIGWGDRLWRTLHGAIGIATEAGELQDTIKKNLYYDKPLDRENIREELGDVLWYVALICNANDWLLSDVMEANIRKLRARYPDKFTTHDALNRDLAAEAKALEGEG